jgi:hypothetical protein
MCGAGGLGAVFFGVLLCWRKYLALPQILSRELGITHEPLD